MSWERDQYTADEFSNDDFSGFMGDIPRNERRKGARGAAGCVAKSPLGGNDALALTYGPSTIPRPLRPRKEEYPQDDTYGPGLDSETAFGPEYMCGGKHCGRSQSILEMGKNMFGNRMQMFLFLIIIILVCVVLLQQRSINMLLELLSHKPDAAK